jgi:hypothetical protein
VWDTSTPSIERFVALFTAAPSVDASVMRDVGRKIDHHAAAPALHLRQLAFAHECRLRARP